MNKSFEWIKYPVGLSLVQIVLSLCIRTRPNYRQWLTVSQFTRPRFQSLAGSTLPAVTVSRGYPEWNWDNLIRRVVFFRRTFIMATRADKSGLNKEMHDRVCWHTAGTGDGWAWFSGTSRCRPVWDAGGPLGDGLPGQSMLCDNHFMKGFPFSWPYSDGERTLLIARYRYW